MTYVVANLHGCFDKFKDLLRKINFTDNDVMYVLGDTVDVGDESMALLCDMSMRYNIIPIVGEHDLRALKLDDDMLVIAGDNVLDFSLTRYVRYAMEKKTSCVMRYYEAESKKLSKIL